MTSRAAPLTVAGVGIAMVLAGCAPAGPAPGVTPTFSSEAEAFAAAEATYQEYVKALNAVDLSNPDTFEAVYAWTTGDAHSEARQRFSRMHAEGWSVRGDSVATLIELAHASEGNVELAVCVDVSGVTLVDAEGVSQVSANRPDVQRMAVTLIPHASHDLELAISDVDGREGGPECG